MASPNGDAASLEQSRKEKKEASMKRLIKVVEPEVEDGPIEYKRQVNQSSAARLRSLKTQMSFRLDQGHGTCLYRVGVEDDGCHSLLDYDVVAKSCCVLEYLARSLNAVVTERLMIQNEVVPANQPKNGTAEPNGNHKDDKHALALLFQPAPEGTVATRIREPTVLGDSMGRKHEITPEDWARIQQGGPTRAELTIQLVQTHVLDPPAVPLAEWDNSATVTTNGTAPTTSSPSTATEQPQPPATDAKKTDVGETMSARNLRVAVVGNVDAGKSTLIGTLTTSCLDDGRGRSRTSIMKHRHEIESGRTSTATTHLMGFRSSGEAIAGRDQIRANKRKGEDEIAREAYRVITLMDLAGHEKYLKTTYVTKGHSMGLVLRAFFLLHLVSQYPRGIIRLCRLCALILVNSRHPPTHMTQHHLNLCCSFGIPVIVVFTKIDGCPEHAFKNCKDEVTKMLRSPEIRKKPYAVRNENDVETVMDKLRDLAPLIETSCVTGEGVDLLQKMLFSLPKRRKHENKVRRSFEFLVEDIFYNVPGVGAVVTGFVNAGELTVGPTCNVYVGPTDDGSFMRTIAKSAHIARINTHHITAGQSACLAFSLNKEMRKKLRRGMVVVQENPTSTRQFDAEICVLKGEGTTIRQSYQAYVHILNVRQSAVAKNIEIVESTTVGLTSGQHKVDHSGEGIVLRPGCRAKVRFEFAQRPEYVRPGMRMLFRDGRVRGVGIITSVPQDSTPPPILVK